MSNRTWKPSFGFVAVVAWVAGMVLMTAGSASASVFIGATPGNYNVDGNWSPSGVPSGTSATINSAKEAVLSDNLAGSKNPSSITLSNGGTLTIASGGGLSSAGDYQTAGGTTALNVTGALTVANMRLSNSGTVSTDSVNLNSSGTLTSNSEFVMGWNVDSSSSASVHTLTMTGGTLGVAGAFYLQGGTNTVNQSDGAVTVGTELKLNGWGTGSGNQTYNLSGGSVTATAAGGDRFQLSANAGVAALMKVSGTGQLTFAGNCPVGNWTGGTGTGTLDVRGSAVVNQTTGEFQMGLSDSYVKVTGGLATINLGQFRTDGHAIGGFVFTLDANGTNISPLVFASGDINLSDAGNAGKIDIATSGFSPTAGQTFDLMKIPQAGTINVPGAGVNALLNAGDTTDWSLSVVTAVGGKDILRLTALTPEPATMALLAIGGAGMLLRRRHGRQ